MTHGEDANRFNGLPRREETVETVLIDGNSFVPWLKPGVNEKRLSASRAHFRGLQLNSSFAFSKNDLLRGFTEASHESANSFNLVRWSVFNFAGTSTTTCTDRKSVV